jgi:hypothetical protein
MKRLIVLFMTLAILIQPGLATQQPVVAQDAVEAGGEQPEAPPAPAEQVSSSIKLYQAQMKWLYPEDIDPPENCTAARFAPLGQDIEHLLTPWGGLAPLYALDQPPAWYSGIDLSWAKPGLDMDAIALDSERLVATWRDKSNGRVYIASWEAIAGWSSDPNNPWSSEASSGRPVLLTKNPRNYMVFARFGQSIKYREWNDGETTPWIVVPGVDDADSGLEVVSMDPTHIAIFYKTLGGTVKFTEWEGEWSTQPSTLGGVGIVSDLSVVSRGDRHVAVFGVDGSNRLVFRERTDLDEFDWSDTDWLELMTGVQIEKPAVASRHAVHIGVVVRDTSGQPYYLSWFPQGPQPYSGPIYLPLVVKAGVPVGQRVKTESKIELGWNRALLGTNGWREPVLLPQATFVSPMTLVPRSIDSLIVLGVQSDGKLYEVGWSEQDGWGNWHAITPAGMMANQSLAFATRRMYDVMLLGRYAEGDDQAWTKHYSSQGQAVSAPQLTAPVSGLPRAQSIVIAEGRTVWASLTRDAASGKWQVEARELSTSIQRMLELDHGDSGQATNRVAVAAADLDMDGSSEMIVATVQSNKTNIDLSVLEFSFPTADALGIDAIHNVWGNIPAGEDVNLAIGNIEPSSSQMEVALAYQAQEHDVMSIAVFQYSESGLTQPFITAEKPYYWEEAEKHEIEIAAGNVLPRGPGGETGEQVVILDVSHIQDGAEYVRDYVEVLGVYSGTTTLEPLGDPYTTPVPLPSSIAGQPYMAGIGAGDMNADGQAEIVYSFGDRVITLADDPLTMTPTLEIVRSRTGYPDTERALVVGDVDVDGRAEAGVSFRGASATDYYLVEMAASGDLLEAATLSKTGSFAVLMGDTDNDTMVAELAGCKAFADVTVVAVVNGAPRWYAADEPIQDASGLYGRTKSAGGGTSDGTTTTYGGSVSVGYEHEFSCPLTGIQYASIRASVAAEFMHTTTGTTRKSSSTTVAEGYEYSGGSRGMVIFNSTEFICYYYDVYPPADPEASTRAMVCKPTGRANAEDFKPLEDWHATSWKTTTGPSWVDVGHRSARGVLSNDLDEPLNYTGDLPIDPGRLTFKWDSDPLKVSWSSQGGFTRYWSVTEMEGGETEQARVMEANVTPSIGGSAGGFALDLSFTYGRGWESSRTVSWEKTLEIGGSVSKFADETRQCYDIVPFIYKAQAITQAGAVYPYLEADYYVPGVYDCAQQAVRDFTNSRRLTAQAD